MTQDGFATYGSPFNRNAPSADWRRTTRREPLHGAMSGLPDAEPILFLHAGGYRGASWIPITNRLTHFRCLMPDLPGHGESRHIPLVSLDQAADEVARLIETRHGGGPVHLAGLSFGAYVGLKLLARHPDLIGRAMFSGVQLGAIPNAPVLNAAFAVLSPLVAFEWFRRRSAAQMGIHDPQIYNRMDGSANLSPRTFRAVGRLATTFDIEDDLPAIRTPTLMLAGAQEHETILHSLGAYARLMPACTARAIGGGGHAWPIRKPDLFARTLRAWIRGAPLPGELVRVATG